VVTVLDHLLTKRGQLLRTRLAHQSNGRAARIHGQFELAQLTGEIRVQLQRRLAQGVVVQLPVGLRGRVITILGKAYAA